jgi:hypothetical protein
VTVVLPDDILVEILSRLPVKALFRFKCVSKAWFGFTTERLRKIPPSPTLQGFLYGSTNNVNYGHLFDLLGRSMPPVDLSFTFLTKMPKIGRIILLGFCNGLVLFLQSQRSEADKPSRLHRVQPCNQGMGAGA